tara:strand:- start:149 stop:592 length:444 start_codon:yes stop_codon:yes gene_type:complete
MKLTQKKLQKMILEEMSKLQEGSWGRNRWGKNRTEDDYADDFRGEWDYEQNRRVDTYSPPPTLPQAEPEEVEQQAIAIGGLGSADLLEDIYGEDAVFIANGNGELLSQLTQKHGDIYGTDIGSGTIEFESGYVWQNSYNPADSEGRN